MTVNIKKNTVNANKFIKNRKNVKKSYIKIHYNIKIK